MQLRHLLRRTHAEEPDRVGDPQSVREPLSLGRSSPSPTIRSNASGRDFRTILKASRIRGTPFDRGQAAHEDVDGSLQRQTQLGPDRLLGSGPEQLHVRRGGQGAESRCRCPACADASGAGRWRRGRPRPERPWPCAGRRNAPGHRAPPGFAPGSDDAHSGWSCRRPGK